MCEGVTAPQSFLKMNIYPWYLRSLLLKISARLAIWNFCLFLEAEPFLPLRFFAPLHLPIALFLFFPGLGSPGLSLLGYSEANIF